MLQQVARVASTFFRDDDIAGRHGGEEFVVLLNGITEPVAMARFDAFREEISRACRAGGQQVTVSIGFTTVDPDEATALDALLRDADRALYEAKRRGRNRVHSFRAMPVDTEPAS